MGLAAQGWIGGAAAASALMLGLGSCLPAEGAGGAAPVAAGSASPPAPSAAPAALAAPPPAFRFDTDAAGQRQQGGVLRGTVPAGTAALTLDGAPVAVADDGRFIVAFDRDAPAQADLAATLTDGTVVRAGLAVAPGDWRIQQIDAPMRGAARSDADFARRRPGELAQINAARAMAVDSNGWRQAFIWPVTGRVSGVFGSQRVYRGQPGSYHSGVDVARPAGTPFMASADGVVTLAASSPFTLEGRLLIVDHGMGLSSAFLHCDRLDVAVGDRVRQGQPLGTIGATGRVTGPHLHWGMRWHRARIDPALLTGAMPG